MHYTAYPLTTGASLFTFTHSDLAASAGRWHALPPAQEPVWEYSKNEDPALLTQQGAAAERFDYVVLQAGMDAEWTRAGWGMARRIEAFDGVSRGGKYLVAPRWAEKVGNFEGMLYEEPTFG